MRRVWLQRKVPERPTTFGSSFRLRRKPTACFGSGGARHIKNRLRRETTSNDLQHFLSHFAELAIKAVKAGVRRIVVAGGETSGAVASAFVPAGLKVGPEIDTGVPVLILDGGPRLGFALKSGNFGADDFFERALDMLGGGGP
ncbi:MAG: nucleotide-binding domain containing protein [Mesorhizobium sp.]